jgi:hypothetical protein
MRIRIEFLANFYPRSAFLRIGFVSHQALAKYIAMPVRELNLLGFGRNSIP